MLHFVLNAFDIFVLQVINLSFYKLIKKPLCLAVPKKKKKKKMIIRQIMVFEASWGGRRGKSYVSLNLIVRNI